MTRAIRKHLADFIALTVLFAIGIGVTGYIISQQESRPYIPFLEKSPFKLKAEFSDAQAVVPGQGQTVRVAGVEVGKIVYKDVTANPTIAADTFAVPDAVSSTVALVAWRASHRPPRSSQSRSRCCTGIDGRTSHV